MRDAFFAAALVAFLATLMVALSRPSPPRT
jgi:hypothetical protein